MNDWLDRENEAVHEEERRKKMIAESNYALRIRQRIEDDVLRLNTDSVYADQLRATPLVVNDYSDYYAVEKQTIDAVYSGVKYVGGAFEFWNKTVGMGFKVLHKSSLSRWDVGHDGERVVLFQHKQILAVPDDVSKYVLRPIVEMLRKERG